MMRLAITAIIFVYSSWPANHSLELPFFYTWLTVGVGELFSMTVGGIVIYLLRQKIDLTK